MCYQSNVKALLSVVVPVYHAELYLDRCVESLVSQTYPNIEIILVDDGSPDECPIKCDQWAKADSRIRVIHKENGGVSSARNAGIAAAMGEYLAFVDSDDYVAQSMYETMIEALQSTDAGIACCGRFTVKDKHVEASRCIDQQTVFTSSNALKEVLINRYIGEAVWDKVFKRELFSDTTLFPVGEINEEMIILPTLFDRSGQIVHVGVPLYYYCHNGDSLTRSGYSKKKAVVLKHLDITQAYLSEYHPELNTYFHVYQTEYCLSMLYLFLGDSNIRKAYKDDYQAFLQYFRKSFKICVKLGYLSLLEKILGYLFYYRMYSILYLTKAIKTKTASMCQRLSGSVSDV